jgi:hypothetical protein
MGAAIAEGVKVSSIDPKVTAEMRDMRSKPGIAKIDAA